MVKKTVRIATRCSRLALQQTEYVKQALLTKYPDLAIELVELTTQGDKILSISLAKIGGKGLFVKELEQSLLANQADIAVHSMKDVPPQETPELTIAAVCEREQPWDAFVSNTCSTYQQLPLQAHVGTSSLRRQAQLQALRPDLIIEPLRGNVDTRLEKLDRKEFDAIILAAAGLIRLQKAERINQLFEPDHMLPAAGQGAIAIQCRSVDTDMIKILASLNDQTTSQCVDAERAIVQRLGGNCQTPIAAYAEINSQQLFVRGKVLSPDGKRCITAEITGSPQHANALGTALALELISKGADTILGAAVHE